MSALVGISVVHGGEDVKSSINRATLTLARQYRALTRQELSLHLGYAASWVSKVELGQVGPTGPLVETYATALQVHPALFTHTIPAATPATPRVYKGLTAFRQRHQLDALAAIAGHLIRTLEAPTTPLAGAGECDPVTLAAQHRAPWAAPSRPVTNLAGNLEAAGIYLVPWHQAPPMFAAAAYITTSAPVIIYNPARHANPTRFAVAQSYAHLLGVTDTKGAEAFASNLLAPYAAYRGQFRDALTGDVRPLRDLTDYWGLHPDVFTTTAYRVGDISESQKTKWNKAVHNRILVDATPAPYPLYPTALKKALKAKQETLGEGIEETTGLLGAELANLTTAQQKVTK